MNHPPQTAEAETVNPYATLSLDQLATKYAGVCELLHEYDLADDRPNRYYPKQKEERAIFEEFKRREAETVARAEQAEVLAKAYHVLYLDYLIATNHVHDILGHAEGASDCQDPYCVKARQRTEMHRKFDNL